MPAMLMTAAMIIGTGIFGAIGAATAVAGSGVLLAMALGGLAALATGISGAQLGVNFPKEGGAFTWAREFNHKTIAFVAGISYLGKGIMSLGVIALAFASYSAQLIPGLSIPLTAVGVLLPVIALNFFGLKLTTKLLIGLVILNVALLGAFVFFAAPAMTAAHFTPVVGFGMTDLIAGAAVFFWTWDGFMRTAIMAGEVKNPRKTIPTAIMGGIAIAAAVFLAVGAVTLGVLGPTAMGQSDTPIFRAAVEAIGSWGGLAVAVAAWTAAFTELVGDMLSASRVMLSMGAAKELPKWLGAIHPKYHVPRNAVLAIGALAGLLMMFDLRPLLAVASVFTIAWYGITHYCALQLSKAQRFAPRFIPWIGLAICAALLLSLPVWTILTGGAVLLLLAALRWLVT